MLLCTTKKEKKSFTFLRLQEVLRRQPLYVRLVQRRALCWALALWGTSVISNKGKTPCQSSVLLCSLERETPDICGTLVTVSLAACNNSAVRLLVDSEHLCSVSILFQVLSVMKHGVCLTSKGGVESCC